MQLLLAIGLCKIAQLKNEMKWNETSLESQLVDAYFSTQLFILFFSGIWDAIINLFKYNTQVNGINSVVHMKCINPRMFTMLTYTLCNMVVTWSQNTSFPNWHCFATTLAIIKWPDIDLFMATSYPLPPPPWVCCHWEIEKVWQSSQKITCLSSSSSSRILCLMNNHSIPHNDNDSMIHNVRRR
jgi:hypothetical protein